MKFSISSWVFGSQPIDQVMRFAADAGYDAMEIRASVKGCKWSSLASLARELSLEIEGLTGDTSWPNEEQDLANRNPIHRQKAIDHFLWQIEAAHEVGAQYLVVSPVAVGRFYLMGKTGEDWQWAVDSVRRLADVARTAGVTLVIEPLNRYESCLVNTADDARRFIDEVGHPNVKTMLDTYHMNIEEGDLETPFLKLKDLIRVVHVADSNRQALGRGHINFGEVFSGIRKSNFDGTIVVECSAPGPNPFQADKGSPNMEWITAYVIESIHYLRKHFIETQGKPEKPTKR